ncbi:MAG: C25 family cysteine peptidase [Holophagales bacterium]|nr:C25 family cysteine peptidase [Holophagales bacterium]
MRASTLLLLLSCWAAESGAQVDADLEIADVEVSDFEIADVEISVERPGVYAVSFEEIVAASGPAPAGYPSSGLRSGHRGAPVPIWIEDGGDGRLGPGDSLRFVASADRLWPRRLHDSFPTAVLMLELEAARAEDSPRLEPKVGEEVESARLRRRLVFEEDHVRAPLASPAQAEAIGSAWFWAPLSHQRSSVFVLDLGKLEDRAADPALGVRIQLLGWSEPDLPEGMSQHLVEVRWNGRAIGEGRWDGRRRHEIRLDAVPEEALGQGGNRLELRIPPRTSPGTTDPLIDLVFVDRIEVRYEVGPLHRRSEPWRAGPSAVATWLPDPLASAGERLYSTGGWSAAADPRRGWRLPPMEEAEELWIADGADLLRPVSVEPMTEPPALPEGLDYIMIAPPPLRAGTERLAAAHRRRGLRVAVASSEAIYDAFGSGYPAAAAVRGFLDRSLDTSPGLRFVLLVGDADWFRPPRPGPSAAGSAEARGLLPTRTYFSFFGPAASDHFFAMDETDETRPRFAIGRLPVADGDELDRVVAKVLGHLESPSSADEPTVLLIGDRTPPSLARAGRSRKRLEDLGVRLVVPDPQPERGLDDSIVRALDLAPPIVHFDGHGSRHSWQLGDSHTLGPEMFFDREDVERLEPTAHLPMVLSVSCTTAPFDHPSADSLGEAMLLAEGRGALAFVGASSRLYTVPRFGEQIVRRLLDGESVGEALAATKRELRHPGISFLYNLLGDPALTLGPTGAVGDRE